MSDVDDLVQRTFLGCVEARTRYQQRASFKTFLFSIARNQLYRYYRDRKHGDNSRLDVTITSIRDLGTSPTGALAGRQHERLLLEALQHLPLDTQVLVELAYWEEFGVDELSAIFEVPTNTIYSRIGRARRQLRDKLAVLAVGLPDDWRVSFESLERRARDVSEGAAE